MPQVTALRERTRGRVAVEVDGTPWRVLPTAVVVRAGLLVGAELDRSRAREVARERRRAAALGKAGRALRARDLTARAQRGRLERAGVPRRERQEAVAVLVRGGLVDDLRVAHARAAALAGRGHGDAAIRWDLEGRGVPAELAAGAVEALEPEQERARRVVAARGAGPATARLLARRGFSDEAVSEALGAQDW